MSPENTVSDEQAVNESNVFHELVDEEDRLLYARLLPSLTEVDPESEERV
jgi:hypothetical protein